MPVVVNKLKKPLFWLGIVGAIKLASDAVFGAELISSDQVNLIANGFSALFAVVGVILDSGIKKE